MAFFTINSNENLNWNLSNLLNDFKGINVMTEEEQEIPYELENISISKKSNNTKYEKTFEQSENQYKNEIEKYYNLPSINKDSNISDFNINISYNNGKTIQIEKENELVNNNNSKVKNEIFLPIKKRKIFKIIYKNKFNVFTQSDYDNDLRKLINETINDFKNGKIKMYTDTDKDSKESEDAKIQHGKKKNINRRKYNSDNEIKKVKSRFLKSLKENSNNKLKSIKSKILFKYLPQEFISNINKEINYFLLDMTYKEILSLYFISNKKNKILGLKNTEHNKSVLKYLEENKKINDLKFLNMTYTELFNQYLESKEFENEINNLKEKEKEKLSYIKNYIIKAYNFINYFSK